MTKTAISALVALVCICAYAALADAMCVYNGTSRNFNAYLNCGASWPPWAWFCSETWQGIAPGDKKCIDEKGGKLEVIYVCEDGKSVKGEIEVPPDGTVSVREDEDLEGSIMFTLESRKGDNATYRQGSFYIKKGQWCPSM